MCRGTFVKSLYYYPLCFVNSGWSAGTFTACVKPISYYVGRGKTGSGCIIAAIVAATAIDTTYYQIR